MRKEEMVQRKIIPHVSSDNGISNSPEKAGLSRRKMIQNDDDKHWNFLDEIEAPLWVDLTLECQSGYDDKDDEWFRVNHPFHQCSSSQLISGFAHSAEVHLNLKLNILEQSSPELPLSVSKSRGKEYTSRDRRQGNQMVTFNNQHAIKSLKKNKSSFVSSGSTRMTGSRTSKGKSNESAGSDSGSRYQKNLTETAGQHDIGAIPPLDDWKFTSNSNFSGKEESVSSSTITFEGSGQSQQNSLEVSSHVLGQTRGFLSALKISLRKSCVTRQASRVEITNGRLSESQTSSSGKSSIGSSSSHGYEKKILTARNQKDVTPYNGDVRMHVSCHQKVHEANLFGAPGVQLAKPKLRSQSCKASSINHGNAKVKQVAHGVNRKCPHTAAVKAKEKVVVRGSGRIPAGAKENLAGKLASSHKLSTRNTMQVQKVTTRYPEKSRRTTSVVLKERINERSKGKKTGTMAEVYFR